MRELEIDLNYAQLDSCWKKTASKQHVINYTNTGYSVGKEENGTRERRGHRSGE